MLMFKLHILLDVSWDELRLAVCSLRLLMGHGGDRFIKSMPKVALGLTLFPVHLPWDLTCGCMRVMRQILSGEVDRYFE
jgi:hypothetical protein